MRKYLVWIMMGLLVFSSLNSGCGGSSSSGGSSTQEGNGGTEQEQQQQQGNENTGQQQETRTTPNTPTSQDNTPTPQNNTPTSQDNTATPISFSVLSGTWKASNGSGTATNGDLTARMTLNAISSNTITFKNVTLSGDSTATLESVSTISMDIAGYGTWEDEFGGYKPYDSGVLTFRNTSRNTWRMERLNHDGEIVRVTITFTSSTTAQIEQFYETETGTVQYSYKLTKQ